MPTGFVVGTTDLDDIFDPYVEGTKPPATGYTVGGVDLNQRYAPLSFGTSAPATGMMVGTADLNTLFAKKGTAAYHLPFHGNEFTASSIALTSTSGYTRAELQLDFLANGTWQVTRIIVRGTMTEPQVILASGTWLPSGMSAGNYEIQYVTTILPGSMDGLSFDGTINNGAVNYSAITATRRIAVYVMVPATSSENSQYHVSINVNLRYGGSVQVSTLIFYVEAFGFA